MAKKSEGTKMRVTLLRSTHGQLQTHRNNARGLGLRRRHQSVEVVATPAVMGMVRGSQFMFKVEELKS
jgi:large subunit ribosomal protein L30